LLLATAAVVLPLAAESAAAADPENTIYLDLKDGSEVIELRQTTLPLLRLTETFQLEEGLKHRERRGFVVVVGLAEKKIGLVVDELLGQQDVVIKSLGSALSFVRGIAGAADLGNQKTILVLDVGGLMNEVLRGDSAFYV
jgi:two-component system chemotaxis sensor kinase CheA